MNNWNDASDFRSSGRPGPGSSFFGRTGNGRRDLDYWVERTRLYLRSRTIDHWLMFVAGLVIGALIA